MALTDAGFIEYDVDRSVVLFTMMDRTTSVPCAITTDAMDQLEGVKRISADQREQQFLRLHEQIGAKASQKFMAVELEGRPPGVILRAIDFRG
jgi:hypothetical protein